MSFIHRFISDRYLSDIGIVIRMQNMDDASGLCADLFRRNLSFLLVSMGHVVAGKELVKELLAFFSGLGRFFQSRKAAQIAGLPLEGDLGTPLAAALGSVNPPHAGGIVFSNPPAADILHAGPFNKMF